MTNQINIDLWHNAGYVLGMLTEAMPIGEVSLMRVQSGWAFRLYVKFDQRAFAAEIVLTSRDLMSRSACERLAIKAGQKWNDDIRRLR